MMTCGIGLLVWIPLKILVAIFRLLYTLGWGFKYSYIRKTHEIVDLAKQLDSHRSSYDPDLEQVTVQAVDQRLSQTPALLLSGEVEGRTLSNLALGPDRTPHQLDELP